MSIDSSWKSVAPGCRHGLHVELDRPLRLAAEKLELTEGRGRPDDLVVCAGVVGSLPGHGRRHAHDGDQVFEAVADGAAGIRSTPEMLEQLHQPDDVDPVVVGLEISQMGAAVAADRESRLRRRPAGDQPPLVEVVDTAPHRPPLVLVNPAERSVRLGMIGSFLEHGCDPLLRLGGPAEAPEDEPEHAFGLDIVGVRIEQLEQDALGDIELLQLDERARRLDQELAPVVPGRRIARQRQHVARAPVPASDPDPCLPVVQDPLEVLRACRLDRAPVCGPEPSQRLVDGAADRLPVNGECLPEHRSEALHLGGQLSLPLLVALGGRRRRAIRRSRTSGRARRRTDAGSSPPRS